jgi:hypothetical protein
MSVRNSLLGALFLAFLVPAVAVAVPLGSSFTYQGDLSQSGIPVTGTVHLRFSLWDAAGTGVPPTGGTQIGSSQIVSNVTVDGGLFTAQVNAGGEFGATAFNGQARWLQIEVCTDGTCASATVLGPRQAMTGTPYSLGPWQISGTSLNYVGGKVGIGTASPANALHIKSNAPAIILEDTAIASQQAGYLSFQNGTAETGWIGYGTSGSPHATWANARSGGDIVLWATGERLRVTSAGNVGIGTSAPAAKLDVRGGIRLGNSGEFQVPAVAGNLKIVRATISSTGAPLAGMESSLTSFVGPTGVYTISFTPVFTGRPTIVATCESTGADRIAMVDNITTGSCTIRVVSGSGTPVNCTFDLIAIGLR